MNASARTLMFFKIKHLFWDIILQFVNDEWSTGIVGDREVGGGGIDGDMAAILTLSGNSFDKLILFIDNRQSTILIFFHYIN